MSSFRVMVNRSRGKKQQEETEEQQRVIIRESYLIRGFIYLNVGNYDQKYSRKIDSVGRWRCGSSVQESSTINLAGLLLAINSNTFCHKTFKKCFLSQ